MVETFIIFLITGLLLTLAKYLMQLNTDSNVPVIFQSPKGYFILYDYLVVFLAIFANFAILRAVVNGRFGLVGYRRFLISLAVSDLYICFVNIISFVYHLWMMYTGRTEKCGSSLLRALQLSGFFANLLNLSGMSVDHFVGIVMNKKVARLAVALIWIVSISLALLDFPINFIFYIWFKPTAKTELTENSQNNNDARQTVDMSYFNISFITDNTDKSLENFMQNGAATNDFDITAILSGLLSATNSNRFDVDLFSNNTSNNITEIISTLADEGDIIDWCSTFFNAKKMYLEICVMALTMLCFVFLTICYGIIFRTVRQTLLQDTSRRSSKKLMFTTIILLGAFAVCWLPFMTFESAMLVAFQYDSNIRNHKSKPFLVWFFFLHNVFNSLLMTYPLVARVPNVQLFILEHYFKGLPCTRTFSERRLAILKHRQSVVPSNYASARIFEQRNLKTHSSLRIRRTNTERAVSISQGTGNLSSRHFQPVRRKSYSVCSSTTNTMEYGTKADLTAIKKRNLGSTSVGLESVQHVPDGNSINNNNGDVISSEDGTRLDNTGETSAVYKAKANKLLSLLTVCPSKWPQTTTASNGDERNEFVLGEQPLESGKKPQRNDNETVGNGGLDTNTNEMLGVEIVTDIQRTSEADSESDGDAEVAAEEREPVEQEAADLRLYSDVSIISYDNEGDDDSIAYIILL